MYFSIEPLDLFLFQTYVCCNIARKCRETLLFWIPLTLDTSHCFLLLKSLKKVNVQLIINLMSSGEKNLKALNLVIYTVGTGLSF